MTRNPSPLNFSARPPVPRRRPVSRRRRRISTGWAVGIALVALVVLVLGVGFTFARVTQKTQTFTVTRVGDRIVTSGSGDNRKVKRELLVYTDHGVFKDVDSFWFLKYNSTDLYGALQVGHRYTCKTSGARIAVTSSYRNLISCRETP